jgi:hypothetical protein
MVYGGDRYRRRNDRDDLERDATATSASSPEPVRPKTKESPPLSHDALALACEANQKSVDRLMMRRRLPRKACPTSAMV